VGSTEDGSAVADIVSMVVKCIQLGNASIYLAVIRALLTFATADHFVAHGHCLLHMVLWLTWRGLWSDFGLGRCGLCSI